MFITFIFYIRENAFWVMKQSGDFYMKLGI